MNLKIFSTILALAPLLNTVAGEFIVTGEAEKQVPERITWAAHRLARLFRSPWRNSHHGLTVAFSPAVPEFSAEVQIRGKAPTLMLNGSADLQRNVEWRRKVYGTLLLAAANARLRSGENAVLPPWLTPALDRLLEARRYEERLLGGNRRSPVLGALLENDRLPLAATVRAIDPTRFDPAALAWTRELSRALFVSGRRKLASPAYLRKCGEAGNRDPDLWWLARPEKQEREFKTAARQLAWHSLAPRPARWTRKKLPEIRKLKLPVLNDEGKPTGKFEEFDVLELADRLRDRPDAQLQCAAFRRTFAEFSVGDSHPAHLALAALADLVGAAVDPPFRWESKMRDKLEEIDTILVRQEKLDDYMKAMERRYAPARRVYRTRLEYIEAFNSEAWLFSAAARRWVDEREAEFR